MKVEILSHTPNPLGVIYVAYRQCYSPGFAGEMYHDMENNPDTFASLEQQADFVRSVMDSGHFSPIEHVSFTFAAKDVSRALTHQLVRHRIASYSQQSQRYVDGSRFGHVVPPRIAADPEALAVFSQCMDQIGDAYVQLKALLEAKGGQANEDARFVLPQAAASNIVFTMNCRSLINFFEHRCCTRAQWELRGMANAMLLQCRQILPEIFAKAGAKCERLGYCPEGKFTCGRYPRLGIASQKQQS